jgi:hypothetical protein
MDRINSLGPTDNILKDNLYYRYDGINKNKKPLTKQIKNYWLENKTKIFIVISILILIIGIILLSYGSNNPRLKGTGIFFLIISLTSLLGIAISRYIYP